MLSAVRTSKRTIDLDWSQVIEIAPGGFAILACIYDSAIEHRASVRNRSIPKVLHTLPLIQVFSTISTQKIFPKASAHSTTTQNTVFRGCEGSICTAFIEDFDLKLKRQITEDILFSCRLIVNELMQNCVDHSGTDRYYLYGGLWKGKKQWEVHIGVLDLGVTIPAKLKQKYDCIDDDSYLDLALQQGISTRRQRPGGLGLFYVFEHLKENDGTLTLLSRGAQLTRYFKNKKIRRQKMKLPIPGTWWMARFPLVENT